VKSHSGPAIFSIVNNEPEQSTSLHQEPKAKRFKHDLDQVPSNILENDEEEVQQNEEIIGTEATETEGLRNLSPPPCEIDYIYGQFQGETLSELFESEQY